MSTTLSRDVIADLACQLHQARKTRVQLRHFSRLHPGMTIEDGYSIQREWLRLEQAEGRTVIGRKIGLTSRAMQQATQITEPDYAPLLDDMVFEQGTDLPFDRFIAPRIEVELAFVLGKPLQGPGVTMLQVLQATDYVVPAVEIIDARIEQFDRDTKVMRKVTDTISDFAANAGIIMGGRPVKPDQVDLRWVGALLNHPATGAAWLANKIAPHGESLQAGQVILAGSFTRPTFAARGDTFHVDYGPLGSIPFRFV
jgi:2-oxo-hept-3-ene-1,7-dioate hydratase